MRKAFAPEKASADWWLSRYEGDEVITTIQRRAHSGGKEDKAKVYKILGWKDEVIKSRVDWLTWLNHVQPVIYESRDHDIITAFSLRRELRQTYKYRYKCSLVKNLLTHWETGEDIGKFFCPDQVVLRGSDPQIP